MAAFGPKIVLRPQTLCDRVGWSGPKYRCPWTIQCPKAQWTIWAIWAIIWTRTICHRNGPKTWEPTLKQAIRLILNEKLFNLIGPEMGYPKVKSHPQNTNLELNNIQGYYVPDIKITYRRVHSSKFRGILNCTQSYMKSLCLTPIIIWSCFCIAAENILFSTSVFNLFS